LNESDENWEVTLISFLKSLNESGESDERFLRTLLERLCVISQQIQMENVMMIIHNALVMEIAL
jgi:hypothetical protein